MIEYTKYRNKNRGYMKLEDWQKAIALYKLIWRTVHVETRIDYKLRAQLADATQSVSSNIAEGYCRRSIHEYIQFLYIALGSLGETLTRVIGLRVTAKITEARFQEIDTLHFEVENKLIRLVGSLETKRESGTWINHMVDNTADSSH